MGGEQETYRSYVRGKRISFDADTLNNFLGTDWDEEQCQYALSMAEGVDFDDVEREDFAARMTWPADPTQEGGGARAAKALAMEEDAEDEDEEEEEVEDEEDSDDYD
ncbi:cysteine-rich hydrophobic domain-containing protein 1-like [Vigna radiata var. radiata]|uniref:Cysteine-rich hydrophobic domain-containing protein 1-like n=1 Tax=Vigna radiata var. radiata TaxID=3916 RepID=A0A1S3T837_VIGRR|nr:cysteine-rich hydrophobic domain-containing protein 1-like [Vigna radiata var. radiata]